MRPTEDIRSLFESSEVRIGAEAERRILSKAMTNLKQKQQADKIRKGIWRIIMENKATSLATASVLVVAVVALSMLFDTGTSTAYAIEKTVEAVKTVTFLHVVMKTDEGEIADERWIEVGADGKQRRYRQESDFLGHRLLIVDNGETVFLHDKVKHEVTLYDPQQKSFEWIGDIHEFFAKVAIDATATLEENVSYKGRTAHRIRYMNQACHIDPDSYLPIALGAYDISYEAPPAGVFLIPDIPANAKVSDERKQDGEKTSQETAVNKQFQNAKRALAMGRFSQAIDLFGKVVEAQPLHNWAWFWLGDACFRAGDFDSAIENYTHVIEMFRKFKFVPYYAHVRRGFAYRAKGLEDQAKIDFAVALPVMIDALRDPDGLKMFHYADDLSKSRKQLPDTIYAYRIIEKLRRITGQEFGYEAQHGPEGNPKAMKAWENWWAENAKSYSVGEQ